ncbi:MAG: hypothetical protein MJA31_03995, partial [Clostridia bacterium]|nr:hypothetical protein [Clostridia bacterium]
MKNSMRLICLLLVLVLVFMSGCAQQSPNETNDADQENNNQQVEETIVLKAGIPNAIGHPHYKGLEVFKAQMEEKSNGKVRVDLFPAGQLGAERDLTEGLQSGTLDLSCITFGVTASFAPELN